MSGSLPIVGGDRWLERIERWRSRLGIAAAVYLTLTTLTGLSIWLLPFSVPNQVAVLVHTVVGLLLLPVCGWYLVKHFLEYRGNPTSHILVLGYFSTVALLVCLASGVVLAWQAAFAGKISYGWDTVHILSTIAFLASGLVHVLLAASLIRVSAEAVGTQRAGAAGYYAKRVLLWTVGVLVLTIGGGTLLLGPPKLQSELPEDYSYVYGEDRPFAPSLAQTPDNEPIDPRVLAGSLSCGSSGCHEQITREWEPSAHRFAAMDVGFQQIQMNMAKLNGPESTRYCAGCHDPISLFSGTKNLYTDTEDLTGAHGYQEGISCLSCHAVRQVDVKGNANYLVVPPARYLFEIEYQEAPNETTQFVRDFLIRAYPWQHVEELGKRVFKTPEYCAACHKQFIDKEINSLGWVQLQNQYDNWRQSRWNHPGDAERTIECRECHMPLVDSTDPSAGDATDYNRNPKDGKHRSHRFVAANQMMPEMLKLPGWEEQVELTRKWLKGEYEIPEIADKWQSGPVVALEMESPEAVRPGGPVKLKMVLTSNKVGHDFPTGPLDIIQAWVQLTVTNDAGEVVFSKGSVDEKGFIEPGTFMFKAEPVDRYGNLIDRHNLWEMVGVRYRRSLFPGFSDTAEFDFNAPRRGSGALNVEARLCYRKMDQYLVNFLFGEDAGFTSPITVMTTQTARIQVDPDATRNADD
jgi:cytochrome c554/c'-like protein